MKLFISYSHLDIAYIDTMVTILQDAGHDPWFDYKLLPGQDWKQELLAAIASNDLFVYAITKNSLRSDWCRWEFQRAVEFGKPILPVLLEEGISIPKVLGKYQYADLTDTNNVKSVSRFLGGVHNLAVRISISELDDEIIEPRGIPSQALKAYKELRHSTHPTRPQKPNTKRNNPNDMWMWIGVAVVAVLIIGGLLAFASSRNTSEAPVIMPTLNTQNTAIPTPRRIIDAALKITPTPSLTPEATYTPTPTFQVQGLAGTLNHNSPPRATTVYSPGGLIVSRNILNAWEMIRDGEYVRAYNILEDEKTSEIGYPYPYYLQAQIDLLNDNPDAARQKLEEGETALENIPSDRAVNYTPMYNLAHGEVLLYEALQKQAEAQIQATIEAELDENDDTERQSPALFSQANQLLNEAEDRFRTAISSDGRMTIAYVQLARTLVAQQEYLEALNNLNVPIEGSLSTEFFTDTLLRVERARVYYAHGSYDLARQEANEVLFYNPWSEEAYIVRVEAVLAMELPGLANDYVKEYQSVYPDSLMVYKLQGDAYLMEGKTDLAILSYEVALQEEENTPNYLATLQTLADVYFETQQYDQANEYYTRYLEQKDDINMQYKRMFAAYNNDDYDLALSDLDQLEDTGIMSTGDVALMRGQLAIDMARMASGYNRGLDHINQAITLGDVSQENLPLIDEYIARANLGIGEYDEALKHIDLALEAFDTGERRLLKGLILQELGNYETAIALYETILNSADDYSAELINQATTEYNDLKDLVDDDDD